MVCNERLGANFPLRNVAAKLFAASLQIFKFRTIVRRSVKRRVFQLLVGERDAEAGAEVAQFLFVQLLLLVGDVLPFSAFAQSVTAT